VVQLVGDMARLSRTTVHYRDGIKLYWHVASGQGTRPLDP